MDAHAQEHHRAAKSNLKLYRSTAAFTLLIACWGTPAMAVMGLIQCWDNASGLGLPVWLAAYAVLYATALAGFLVGAGLATYALVASHFCLRDLKEPSSKWTPVELAVYKREMSAISRQSIKNAVIVMQLPYVASMLSMLNMGVAIGTARSVVLASVIPCFLGAADLICIVFAVVMEAVLWMHRESLDAENIGIA